MDPPLPGASSSGTPAASASCNNKNEGRKHLPTTLSRRRKSEAQHEEASLQLKRQKLEASVRWREHLAASSRSSSARGPIVSDGPPANDEGSYNKIHPSHTRVCLKSIVFCKKCGYWMLSKPLSLRKPCPGMAMHRGAAGKLARMMRGLHPESSTTTWPDGSCARTPVPLRMLDT